ncbi:MAG: asparagine synthase-related protein [Planctomycetota bacterium]
MGAILAIIGEAQEALLGEQMQRMVACSPYRGKHESVIGEGFALAVMSREGDASIGEHRHWIAAIHGFVGNWNEVASACHVRFEPGTTSGQKLAVAFDALGERALGSLRGEFAVLVLNRREREMHAARDVPGTRPLFWTRHKEQTFLGSEVRQVLAGAGMCPELDVRAWTRLVLTEALPPPTTLFAGVNAVPAGHTVRFHIDGGQACAGSRPFWALRGGGGNRYSRPTRWPQLAEGLRERIDVAVRRSVPDSPYAVALSGGMDSSSIWAMLPAGDKEHGSGPGRAAAVSMVFPGIACDESQYVEANLRKSGSAGVTIRVDTVPGRDWLEEALGSVDSVFAVNFCFVDMLARACRQHDRNVLLRGDGGDHFLDANAGGDLASRLALSPHRLVRAIVGAHRGGPGPGASVFRDLVARPWRRASRDGAIALRSRVGRALGRGGVAWRVAEQARKEARRALGLHGRDLERAGAQLGPGGSWLEARLGSFASDVDAIPREQRAAQFGLELRRPLADLDLLQFVHEVPEWAWVSGPQYKSLFRAAMGDTLPPQIRQRAHVTTFESYLKGTACWFGPDLDLSRWRLVRDFGVEADLLRQVLGDGYGTNLLFASHLGICEAFSEGLEKRTCRP